MLVEVLSLSIKIQDNLEKQTETFPQTKQQSKQLNILVLQHENIETILDHHKFLPYFLMFPCVNTFNI